MDDDCFTWFVHTVERHKDFFDLVLKVAGITLSLIGALWLAMRYFMDRKEERKKTELDIRRKAYFDLFAAIPLQQDSLREFFDDREAHRVAVPIEYYKALHGAHLLARHDSFRCIVNRNAIFHIGIMDISELKRDAIHVQESARATRRDDMTESEVRAWRAYWKRSRKLTEELGDNYRELLGFARMDIGLTDEIAPILEILENDQKAALAELDRRMP